MSEDQIAAITKRTAKAAGEGEFELFKTSAHFDSTTKNIEWLGEESPEVKQLGGGAG